MNRRIWKGASLCPAGSMPNPDRRLIDLHAPAQLLKRPEVAQLMGALSCDGEETRIVGGAVRNSLLGLPVNDIDMATTALPEETMHRAKAAGLRAVPTGIAHGTITIIAAGRPVEVTTLRRDLETDGRHAVVAFGRDFREDAARRDFTVNALMVDAGGQLHDEAGGLADLAEGRIRFIGQAHERITEDALRILRFYRFHAAYGHGAPDVEGRTACITGRAGLSRLSPERIRAEMLKLVMAKGAAPALAAMADDGLLLAVLGGVAQLARFEQVMRADDETARDPVARLAVLAVSIREDALRLREVLRLSNAEMAMLHGFGAAYEALHGDALPKLARLRRLADAHGLPEVLLALSVKAGHVDAATIANLPGQLRATPELRLSGRDLMARGVIPGETMGGLLATLRDQWIEAGCPASLEAQTALLEAVLAARAS